MYLCTLQRGRVGLFFEESIWEIPVHNRYWKKVSRIPLTKGFRICGTQLKSTSTCIYSTSTIFLTICPTPLDFSLLFLMLPFVLLWLFIFCFDSYFLSLPGILSTLLSTFEFLFILQTNSKGFFKTLPCFPHQHLFGCYCLHQGILLALIKCFLVLGFIAVDSHFVPLQALEWQCHFLRIPCFPLYNLRQSTSLHSHSS